MPKFAILLILIGTTTFLWPQTEAKPFLFLPPNFFTLTTRAPTTSANSLSQPPPSNNLFQLPLNIIQRKLNFFTNLLSNFVSGGNLQFGLKFNTGISTQRPRITTERSTESGTYFRPVLNTSSAVFTNTPRPTVSSTERTVSLPTKTAVKELLSVIPTIETLLNTTSELGDQKHSTEKITDNNFENIDSTTNTILATTKTTADNIKPLINTKNPVSTEKYSLNVDTTSEGTASSKKKPSTEKSLFTASTERTDNLEFTTTEKDSLKVDSTSEGTVGSRKETSTEELLFRASTERTNNLEFTTTEKDSLKVDSTSEGIVSSTKETSTKEPLFKASTESDLINIVSTTEGFVIATMEPVTQQPLLITTTEKVFRDSTPNRIMILTTEAPTTVKPTIITQQPVITTSTENIGEHVDSTTISTQNNGISVTTGFDNKVHKENAEVVTDSVQNRDDGKNSGAVSSDGFNYQKSQVSDDVNKSNGYAYNRPRPDSENELFNENISRRYLPVL